MDKIDRVVELDKKEKEARKAYDESRNPKFLKTARQCLTERVRLMSTRKNQFTQTLAELKS